jgi:hypothetical protein
MYVFHKTNIADVKGQMGTDTIIVNDFNIPLSQIDGQKV